MNALDVLDKVRRRGGDVRVSAYGIEYRPRSALTPAEVRWLVTHRRSVLAALAGPMDKDRSGFRRWLRAALGVHALEVGQTPEGEAVWLPLGRRWPSVAGSRSDARR